MWHIPNFFKTIPLEQVHLPYEMRTNAELLAFANAYFRPRPSRPLEIYMICDIAQSIITFCCCSYVMLRKGRMKDARLVTLCQSPYGRFLVPNFTHRPLAEWLFYIPLPWLPLALGAFYTTYGFVITCSPRSPISNLAGKRRNGLLTTRLSFMHLPLPHSAWVMNTFMLGVGIIMVVYNVVITSFSGRARNLTHQAQYDVYTQLLIKDHPQEWLDAAPSEETLLLVRMGAYGLMNVYRWCCAALASYVVLIVITVAMLVLYSIPNHIFLLDHLCRIFPDKDLEQPQNRTLLSNIKTLWKIGSPRHLQGPSYSAFKKTWMMTMVGHSCTLAILAGVLLFAVAPVYLIFVPWDNILHGRSTDHQVTFIIAYVIIIAFITAALAMAISATLTFDDIFNTVSGLGNSKSTTSFDRNNNGLSVYAEPWSTASTGIPSPQSPTFAFSPRSPTLLASPNHLRPMRSFTPSSIGSHGEKTFTSDEMGGGHINQVLVVTETTVHVDQQDVEATAGAVRSSDDMHPGGLPVSPPAAKPYNFLRRNKSLQM
ncbi:hypothetical protein [Sporisorium scitamineum]|uniref:Uncharacterized protein n=1 Tax=Sporisorium scitamineum TaxID=49012 RepID=A0A0F7S8Y4_9BASI|nr:hypothetical protein [Sporisorium scitamineum]